MREFVSVHFVECVCLLRHMIRVSIYIRFLGQPVKTEYQFIHLLRIHHWLVTETFTCCLCMCHRWSWWLIGECKQLGYNLAINQSIYIHPAWKTLKQPNIRFIVFTYTVIGWEANSLHGCFLINYCSDCLHRLAHFKWSERKSLFQVALKKDLFSCSVL